MDYPTPNVNVSLNGVRFDSTIPPGAKILFAELSQWDKENGSFPYEAKKLADMYHVSAFTIRKWIKILAQHKLIHLEIDLSKGNQQKCISIIKEK